MEKIKTFSSKCIKGMTGFLLFIPLTMISFSIVCFQKNEWPWSKDL